MVLALILVLITLPAFVGTASADVLLIEEVRQAEGMKLPANGMNKSEVRSAYGDPSATHAAVGDPPITRWDYANWSVYFEYDLVLFTVLKKGQVIEKNKD
jgi:hypothetical protein